MHTRRVINSKNDGINSLSLIAYSLKFKAPYHKQCQIKIPGKYEDKECVYAVFSVNLFSYTIHIPPNRKWKGKEALYGYNKNHGIAFSY